MSQGSLSSTHPLHTTLTAVIMQLRWIHPKVGSIWAALISRSLQHHGWGHRDVCIRGGGGGGAGWGHGVRVGGAPGLPSSHGVHWGRRTGRHRCTGITCNTTQSFLTHLPLDKMADNVFRCIFMNGKFCILIKISLKFVPKRPIDNNPALVLIMAWRRIGDKLLSEPMLTQFTDAFMWH